ncbi:MAG: SEL1-like repeat protein [Bacteroidaceae bacterium]|nr:SEL1-like repeat protein [Bacteroidaceae bacterium]
MKKLLYTALLLLVALFSHADEKSLDKMAFNAAVVNNLFPQERVYLHFDNTAYYLGETMWFKAYVTEGVKDAPSTLSKVLYVELVAPEGYVVETKKYKIDEKGTCNGEFELKPLLLSGYYEIRAYTRYMLNWGKEAVFSRVFPIFDKVNGNNWDFKNMLDRRRGFMYRGEWVSSELPDVDLKFYPEGGHLIEGIETTVAYELRGEDGIAGEDTVYIFANKKQILKSVPTHAGKGTFSLTPETGVKYHAEVKRGKKEHKFEFPAIEKEGVAIAVKEEGNNVSIKVSNNLESSTALGCAVLHRGELSHYQKYYSDNNGKIIIIDKDSLREGVNRVIVFVDDSLPLAERQFFVLHENIQPGDRETAKLKVTANGEPLHKLSLKPHEKFSVTIEREDGKPIEENTELSLSISDAAGRQQTSYTHNMYSYLLLGSELKGYIPDAARYFDVANKNRAKELDLLMLTNGWTSYDWSKLAKKDIKLDQPMEKGITVKGTFYKKEENKKFGQLGKYILHPQKNYPTKFEICYKDSLITAYDFITNAEGVFQLQLEDFYGKSIGAITPEITGDQMQDSIFSFCLDRYYSPEFRLYDYWERHTGLPVTDREKREQEAKSIKLRPFEYMLSSVEVTEFKERERYSRPPRSEMRFDYLDEWEYAQDVTYLTESRFVNGEIDEYINNEFFNDTISLSKNGTISSIRVPVSVNFIKYIDGTRYWNYNQLTTMAPIHGYIDPYTIERQNPYFMMTPPVLKQFVNSYTAEDIVKSAMKRHNYNWAYWVQLMVVAGKYSSDSIPHPDGEYIKGKNPQKMGNFKEFVIRSDIGTREQFKNYLGDWIRKGHALDNKLQYAKFYLGFLSQTSLNTAEGIDGYNKVDIANALYRALTRDRNEPYHPNYVACMIPFEEGEERKGIVPELHVGGTKRYTSVQGYSESKQFYSPDYKGKQPSEKDFRRTLIWVPSAKTTDGKAIVELCNSSVAKNINVNVEGCGGGTIYGSDLNILTRTLSEEQKAAAEAMKLTSQNNKEVYAHCLKVTNEGVALYREKEYARAFEKFYEAAALKHPAAMFYAGVCYTNGEGTEIDNKKAFNMFRAAANGKHIAAMHNLANCYMLGKGTKANNSLALKWYTTAADSGYVRSVSMLAKSYEEGLFTEKNSEKAIEWYNKAAEKDEPYAIYKIARYYEQKDSIDGKKGKALRESEAIELFTRAAELKNVHAQMKLAECYGNGRYVKKNKKLRFGWLLRAANSGHMEAQELVGECYEKGRGVKESDIKAYQYYKRAAEQGSELGKIKAKEYELFKFYK